jgi:hypothetical protein
MSSSIGRAWQMSGTMSEWPDGGTYCFCGLNAKPSQISEGFARYLQQRYLLNRPTSHLLGRRRITRRGVLQEFLVEYVFGRGGIIGDVYDGVEMDMVGFECIASICDPDHETMSKDFTFGMSFPDFISYVMMNVDKVPHHFTIVCIMNSDSF